MYVGAYRAFAPSPRKEIRMKIAALLLAAVPSALAFTAPLRASPMRAASRSTMKMATGSVFENAVNDFKESFPAFYAKGWGPTTKAERWNGRHAMFGWFAMVFTGYAQAHNLIPDFDTPLDLKEWGTLATLYGTQTITNGRAIILIAHVHALMMSVCAAIAPLSYQDKLFLEDGRPMSRPPASCRPWTLASPSRRSSGTAASPCSASSRSWSPPSGPRPRCST